MKKSVSILLVVLLLFSYVFTAASTVYASKKAEDSRAIAIVFDNSGSMYINGEQAWCRATYAMEVFASMLNKGDTLQIYPMHPIIVGGNEYTMDTPFTITDATQSNSIREIYTKVALGTPIESVDAAINGVNKLTADKKYIIVLTDGNSFYKNNAEMSAEETKTQLDSRFKEYANETMTMMYLGIGERVVMPDTVESKYFTKKQAKNSEDTLSALTEMCNLIFGRDILPKSYISGQNLKLDISINKLIVFVQGEDVSDLSVSANNNPVGELESTVSTKYGTAGCGNYNAIPDQSLQGMMVTYTDCSAGNYTVNYKGTATNIEVYFEPNADLDFVFTDAGGNLVDPNSLYEGEYKVSFGMKDAKTGQLISSELLGNPHYEGSYSINGQEYPFSHDGKSGEVPVALNMNDAFDANLTVTYLSGYTITKDSSGFGWPEGGITVMARPAGDLKLKITGGDSTYSLQDLDKGKSFVAEVYYQGEKLTGKELENVQLQWEPDTSYAEIKKEFADDHYELTLHYKDPKAPANTICGKCDVVIHAIYAAKGSDESKTQATLTYKIEDDYIPIKMELLASQDYIVISQLDESEEIVAKFTMNGKPLTAEEFKSIVLHADCGGIKFKATPNEKDSSYSIKLLPTDGIAENDYSIKITAKHIDHIGRETLVEDSFNITLSNTPIWVKWAFGLLFLLILFILAWIILHIKVLPAHLHTTKKLSSMNFDGDDVTKSTNFLAEIKKKGVKVQGQYGGKKFGVSMDVTPGKESYLYKPQKRRSAEVKVASVRKFGSAKIQEAMIGSAKYVVDENTGKLVPALPNQKPFVLTNGMMVKFSGTIQDAGIDKDFEVVSKLNFKKK